MEDLPPEKMDRRVLWSYFEKTGIKHFNFHIVKCVLCTNKNPSNQSTIVGRLENLRRHLNHYHREEICGDSESMMPPSKRMRKSKDNTLWSCFDKTGHKHFNFHIVECKFCKQHDVTTTIVGRLEKLRQHLNECEYNTGTPLPSTPIERQSTTLPLSITKKAACSKQEKQLIEFLATNNVDIDCVESITIQAFISNPPSRTKVLELLSKYAEDLYINDQNKIKSYCNIHEWNQCTLSIIQEDCKEQSVYLKFPTNLECIYKENCFVQTNDQIEQMLTKHEEIKSVVTAKQLPLLHERYNHLCFLSCYNYQLTYIASNLLTCFQPFLMKTGMLIEEIYYSNHFTAALNELLPKQSLKLIPLNSSKTNFSHVAAVFRQLLQMETGLRQFSQENPSIVNDFSQEEYWTQLKDTEKCFRVVIESFYSRENRTMADVMADYIQFYTIFQEHSTQKEELIQLLQQSFNELQEHALYCLAFLLHPVYSKDYSPIFHEKMALQFASIYYKKLIGLSTTQLHQQTMKWINKRYVPSSDIADPIKFWETMRTKAPELSELATTIFSMCPQTTLSADYYIKGYGFPFGYNNDIRVKGQFVQFHHAIFQQYPSQVKTDEPIPILQQFQYCNTENEAYYELFQSWQQTLNFPQLHTKPSNEMMNKHSFQSLTDQLHTISYQQPTRLYQVLYTTKLQLQDLPKKIALTTTLV